MLTYNIVKYEKKYTIIPVQNKIENLSAQQMSSSSSIITKTRTL